MSKTLTPEFRVSYCNVFEPKLNELNGKQEYSCVALFPKGADLTKLYALAKEAMEKKWGTDSTKWPQNRKSPFRKAEERMKNGTLPNGYEEGMIFITLKSQQKPGLVDQKVQDIIDTSQFYSGCYARASVTAYAYDNKGNRGVAFGLGNIQKTRDGETLGGRSKPEEDFEPIAGAAEEVGVHTAGDLFN